MKDPLFTLYKDLNKKFIVFSDTILIFKYFTSITEETCISKYSLSGAEKITVYVIERLCFN